MEIDAFVTAEVGEHEDVNVFGSVECGFYFFAGFDVESAMDSKAPESE